MYYYLPHRIFKLATFCWSTRPSVGCPPLPWPWLAVNSHRVPDIKLFFLSRLRSIHYPCNGMQHALQVERRRACLDCLQFDHVVVGHLQRHLVVVCLELDVARDLGARRLTEPLRVLQTLGPSGAKNLRTEGISSRRNHRHVHRVPHYKKKQGRLRLYDSPRC